MNKFPLITFLTFLLFLVGVNAAPSFNIVEDSVNISSSAGSPASGNFKVNNTGTEDLNIEFDTSSPLTRVGGTEELFVSSLSDMPLGNDTLPQNVDFSVEITDNQQKPGLYTGTLTAVSGSFNDTITINVNVIPTYSVSTVPANSMNIGSASLNSTHTRTFDVTNTGNANITNIFFDFSESGFNLQTNKSNFTLLVGATELVGFNITIPSSSSTGNVTLGFVKLDSTELKNTKLFDVRAEVGGGLEIEDLDVFLATRIRRKADGTLSSGNGNDLDVFDGRRLRFDGENAGPESVLRFNFNIENTFSDKEDIDIDDITVKVTIEEIDDGDDLDEESNEFNLDSDQNEDVDIIIKIPLSVDVGVYDVLIVVEGEDDDGNQHTAQMSLKIDIDKEARNVIVSEASLFPSKVKCTGSSTLTATIKNIGSREEDEAMIEIISSDLDINFVKKDMVLEEDPFDTDNEYTKRLIINVNRDTPTGTYPIKVNAYLQEQILWESRTVNFVVESCSAVQHEEEPEEQEDGTTVDTAIVSHADIDEEVSEGEEIPVLEPTTSTEVPLTRKPLFWVVLVLLNVALIGGIAFYAVKVVGKK